jgi:hypothetical protein
MLKPIFKVEELIEKKIRRPNKNLLLNDQRRGFDNFFLLS